MSMATLRGRFEPRAVLRRQALLRPGIWVVLVIALLLPFVQGGAFYQQQFQLVAVYSLVAVGLNINLYAGELVVGQSAIFGAGAYAAAVLLDRHPGTDGLVVLLFSVVVATLVGLAIGIPGLRVGRWYLAMMSFFMIIVAQDLLGQLESWTGGHAGIVGLPPLTVLGTTVSDPLVLYFVCIAVLAAVLLLTRNMLTSSWGAALATLRRSDVAAQSVGMSRYRTKLMVYGLSAIPCGIAGALFVYAQGLVLPDIFSINLSVLFLAAAVLGGERTLIGPIVGMALLQAVPIYSVSLQAWAPVMYGAFLIIVTVAVPGGIAGTLRRLWLRIAAVRDAEAAEVVKDIDLAAVDAGGSVAPRRETLTVRGVDKSFRGLHALQDVSLVAEPGAITALIGANGSGKTTLLNIVSGFYRADAGTVTLGDVPLRGLGPHRVARAGIGRTFQTPILPEGTTVLNAVAAALHWRRRATLVEHMLMLPRSRRERREWKARAYALLCRVGLGESAHRRASDLSLGHRRMLELARALALEPSVMLLDEPASGLSESEVAQFRTVVHGLREAGIAVVLVEHNLKLVLDLADVLFVLDHGRLIASGTAHEVRAHPEVVRSYLGEQTSVRVRPRQRPAAPVARGGEQDGAVHVRGVDVELGSIPILHGTTLDVEGGSLGVVLGPNGAGKTTLLRTLSGLSHPRAGSIVVLGREVSQWAPNRIARVGVQHVQEGKRVFRRLSVEDNLAIGGYRSGGDGTALQRVYGLFPVLEEKRRLAAGSLSGGEQQMLAIAQSLMGEPRVLLLDEPSAGLAPLLVRRMFEVLERLRGTGLTILLVEQIVAESLALADSGSVLVGGRVVLAGDGPSLRARPDLDALYFGAEPAAATAVAAAPSPEDH
jgi:branched-chain amino acid transport system ATP-binding protein